MTTRQVAPLSVLWDQHGFHDVTALCGRDRVVISSSANVVTSRSTRSWPLRYSWISFGMKLRGTASPSTTPRTLVLVGGQADAAVALAADNVAISRDDYIDLHGRMLADGIAAAQAALA